MKKKYLLGNHLVLIVTRRCNLNCLCCPVEKKNISMNKMAAFRAVDLFLDSPGRKKTIKFFGGEPLLEFNLIKKIIYYAETKAKDYNKNINFTITTNGTLLNKEILNYMRRKRIHLVLSIGDSKEKNALIERNFKQIINLPEVMLNLFISPITAKDFYNNFIKFFNLGFRKFNFLPAYYILWDRLALNILALEFKKIARFYLKNNSSLYFHNLNIDGEIPLFNLYPTVDCDGEIYPSNIILTKDFSRFRDELKIGHINNSFITQRQFNFNDLLNRAIDAKRLDSTWQVDNILTKFVDYLKRESCDNKKRADIKTGFSCNNNCQFCVVGEMKELGNKSTTEVKKILKEARKDCDGVTFTGGEPTIRDDIIDLVSYAKKLGFKIIQIQTNGRMFAYSDFCKKIIKAGANEFCPAIHGHIPELHDYLTDSPGSFNQTLLGIKNLKNLEQRVITNTVIAKPNYRHLPEIAQLLVNLGVDQFQFAFVHAMGNAAKNFDSIVPRKSLIMPYVKKGLDIGIKAGRRVMTEAIPYCFMRGYEDYVAEKFIPDTKIYYDFYNVVENFTETRQKEGKLKGPGCKKCKYYNICEGPWKEYPEHFGWEEFYPQ